MIRYTVDTIRSGQPRAYADHIHEYLITIEHEKYGKAGLHPWVEGGDVEERIKREEADRAAGRMSGGYPPDALRKQQADWAKALVRALCRNFREKDDPANDWASPKLASLKVDHKAGTVRAVITEAYTG